MRKRRVRATISGSAARPRLSVFRSLKHISAQIIDDTTGRTLVAVHDREIKPAKGTKKVDVARETGKLIGDKAKKAGVTTVVFDRNGFVYTGRVSAFADGARESGLQF